MVGDDRCSDNDAVFGMEAKWDETKWNELGYEKLDL